MKSLKCLPFFGLAIAILLFGGVAAGAQEIDFSADSNTTLYAIVPIGGTVSFSGVLSDAAPSATVYINGDNFSSTSVPSASLFEDDSSCFQAPV